METGRHTKETGRRAVDADSMPTVTRALVPPHSAIPQLGPDVKPGLWMITGNKFLMLH